MDRRHMLINTSSALGGALAAGCASISATPSQAAPFALTVPAVPIAGASEVFPVHRIYCIGRNYAAHAREMGSTPRASRPSSSRSPATPCSTCRPARPWTTPTPP